jgi:hypothetical protein
MIISVLSAMPTAFKGGINFFCEKKSEKGEKTLK